MLKYVTLQVAGKETNRTLGKDNRV